MARRRTVLQLAKEAEARERIEKARLATAIAKGRRKAVSAALSTYRAAEKNRLTRDWNAKNVSADLAILPDKLMLDARARMAVRDDAYAASIVKAFVRNVVGKGINPSPAARNSRSGESLEAFNKQMADLWWDWASRPGLVDAEKRRNFTGICRWVISEYVTVGEAFIARSYRERDAGCGLFLQCFESEQLDRYKTSHTEKGITRDVRGGVEVDEYGAAVAYHFYPRHPNDAVGMARPSPMMLQSIRIEADRVCHVFDADRARQTRGVTRLAPVLERLRNIDQYDYSQRVAARAEANIGFAITSPVDDQNTIGMEGASGEETTDANGNDLINTQPCMVARLAPGEELTSHTPTRPGNLYEPFMKANLRATSAGVGISYEQVARDFTNGSYSSQRQAMLEDRREYEPLIEMLVTFLCQPVYEDFLEWSIVEGSIRAQGYWRQPEVYRYAEWRGQGWAWIDPQKEWEAHKVGLELNLITKRDIAQGMGADWREVIRQRAEEAAFEAEVGAPQVVQPKALPPGQSTAPESQLNDTGEVPVSTPNEPATAGANDDE